MLPFNVAFPTYYRGDTWPGMTIHNIKIEGAAPVVNLSNARMQFRTKMGDLGFEYNTVQDPACKGAIIILDPVVWSLQVEHAILPLDKGVWYWDLELTAADGIVITFLKGRLRVKPDITYR